MKAVLLSMLVAFSASSVAADFSVRAPITDETFKISSNEPTPPPSEPVRVKSFMGVNVAALHDGDNYAGYLAGTGTYNDMYLERAATISSISFSGMGRLWAPMNFYDGHTGTYLGSNQCPSGSYNCWVTITFPPITTDYLRVTTARYVYLGEIEIK